MKRTITTALAAILVAGAAAAATPDANSVNVYGADRALGVTGNATTGSVETVDVDTLKYPGDINFFGEETATVTVFSDEDHSAPISQSGLAQGSDAARYR